MCLLCTLHQFEMPNLSLVQERFSSILQYFHILRISNAHITLRFERFSTSWQNVMPILSKSFHSPKPIEEFRINTSLNTPFHYRIGVRALAPLPQFEINLGKFDIIRTLNFGVDHLFRDHTNPMRKILVFFTFENTLYI